MTLSRILRWHRTGSARLKSGAIQRHSKSVTEVLTTIARKRWLLVISAAFVLLGTGRAQSVRAAGSELASANCRPSDTSVALNPTFQWTTPEPAEAALALRAYHAVSFSPSTSTSDLENLVCRLYLFNSEAQAALRLRNVTDGVVGSTGQLVYRCRDVAGVSASDCLIAVRKFVNPARTVLTTGRILLREKPYLLDATARVGNRSPVMLLERLGAAVLERLRASDLDQLPPYDSGAKLLAEPAKQPVICRGSCPVHKVPLAKAWVPSQCGLPGGVLGPVSRKVLAEQEQHSDQYRAAEKTLFPFAAPDFLPGDCTKANPKEIETCACPLCTQARWKWLAEHKRPGK